MINLMYHSFNENYDRYHISPQTFENQLKFIKTRPDIILTIDDGVPSVYDIAFPLLKKYRIPTIVFIITSEIGKTVMSKDQIKELHDSGIEIQSHSHTHKNHTLLSKNQIIEEGEKSKSILESIVSDKVNKYSFPGGYYSKSTCKTLNSIGYNQFYTSDYGINLKKNNDFTVSDRVEIYGEKSVEFYISKSIILLRTFRNKLLNIKKLYDK